MDQNSQLRSPSEKQPMLSSTKKKIHERQYPNVEAQEMFYSETEADHPHIKHFDMKFDEDQNNDESENSADSLKKTAQLGSGDFVIINIKM